MNIKEKLGRVERLEGEGGGGGPPPFLDITDEEWLYLAVLHHNVRWKDEGRVSERPVTPEEHRQVQAELARRERAS